MSDPTDDADLDRIGERLNAVPPEPWSALGTGVRAGDHWYVIADYEAILTVACNDGRNEDQRQPLAEFVAHAPTDIRVLLAEVARLRALTSHRQREAMVNMVRAATRLVRIERDEARALLADCGRVMEYADSIDEAFVAKVRRAGGVA